MPGYEIQSTRKVEFKDDFIGRKSSIEAASVIVLTISKPNLFWDEGWSWGSLIFILTLVRLTCLVPCINGINIKLSCGVRIELT